MKNWFQNFVFFIKSNLCRYNTCKLAVTYAKSMLATNATRAEILDEMKSLCDLIPTRGGRVGTLRRVILQVKVLNPKP